MTLPLLTYPAPELRRHCQPVEHFDADLAALVAGMVETMRLAPGLGLAANQVGDLRRVAIVDLSCGARAADMLVLVNPVITFRDGEQSDTEGCLSIPGFTWSVPRPEQIRVEARSISGRAFSVEAEGLLARCICHEVDHLDGILFTDRVVGRPAKRRAAAWLREMEARAA